MKGMLRRCASCGTYTLRENDCPVCGGQVRIPHPAKFSPQDRFSRFRIALKEKEGSCG
ncbi:MAG: RNA-protein complex protein Nop10 [Candidatus Verstraetearchaeota archaeon]|nr:RNA-protein complex protein Nop10 [Candidatus Verstraetearchaeota archaeon]